MFWPSSGSGPPTPSSTFKLYHISHIIVMNLVYDPISNLICFTKITVLLTAHLGLCVMKRPLWNGWKYVLQLDGFLSQYRSIPEWIILEVSILTNVTQYAVDGKLYRPLAMLPSTCHTLQAVYFLSFLFETVACLRWRLMLSQCYTLHCQLLALHAFFQFFSLSLFHVASCSVLSYISVYCTLASLQLLYIASCLVVNVQCTFSRLAAFPDLLYVTFGRIASLNYSPSRFCSQYFDLFTVAAILN